MNTFKEIKAKIALLLLLLLLSSSSSLVCANASYESESESNQSSSAATSSEGCNEGYGYKVDDPDPICEPLDKIGEGPPEGAMFCAALGCPYNPPDLEDEDQEKDGNQTEK